MIGACKLHVALEHKVYTKYGNRTDSYMKQVSTCIIYVLQIANVKYYV